MPKPKDKSVPELIEDTEDLISQIENNLKIIKEKYEEQVEIDEFERHLP